MRTTRGGDDDFRKPVTRHQIRSVVIALLALLVGNAAGSLAGGLAGGLAFAAATVLYGSGKITRFNGLNSFHDRKFLY